MTCSRGQSSPETDLRFGHNRVGGEKSVAQSEDRQLITRYLLGEMDEDEMRGFEERYFADDELFAEMLVVEAELIERYVGGELSREECKRFEQYFLRSDERWRRVEFRNSRRTIVQDDS